MGLFSKWIARRASKNTSNTAATTGGTTSNASGTGSIQKAVSKVESSGGSYTLTKTSSGGSSGRSSGGSSSNSGALGNSGLATTATDSTGSIQQALKVEAAKVIDKQSQKKPGLFIPETDKFGRSASWYKQQELNRTIRQFASKEQQALQSSVNRGDISADRASELLQQSINKRIKDLELKERAEAISKLSSEYFKLKKDGLIDTVKVGNNKFINIFSVLNKIKNRKDVSEIKKQDIIGKGLIKIFGKESVEKLRGKFTKENLKKIDNWNNLTKSQKTLLISTIPAEISEKAFSASARGWDDLLFTTKEDSKSQYKLRGLGIKRTPVTNFIPKAIAGAGEFATYFIPGVGTALLVSDITKSGKIFFLPGQTIKKSIDQSYESYSKDTKVKENERLLTKKEFILENSSEISKQARKSALIGAGISIALLNLKGAGKLLKRAAIQSSKISPKIFKFTQKVAKKRTIKGVKVSKKEFKSYKEATKEFEKLKNIRKYVDKIKSKGSIGITQKLNSKLISSKERELISLFKKLPPNLANRAEKISTTVLSQKFTSNIPIIKRFISKKKAYWRIIFKDKDSFQNTISYSLLDKSGKNLGSISFNTLSSKPINKFKSIANSLKYGRNKTLTFSKSSGKDFVVSEVMKASKKGIKKTKFISKIKAKKSKGKEKIRIETRKIPKVITGKSIKSKFKESIPVSATKGEITKIKSKGKVKYKKGKLSIKNTPRISKLIKARSIINPIIIDTSKLNSFVLKMDKLKFDSLSKAKKIKLKKFNNSLKLLKDKNSKIIGGKERVILPNSKLIQIKKVAKNLRKDVSIKEALSAGAIPKKVRLIKRIEGIKELKNLKNAKKNLVKLRINLIKSKVSNKNTNNLLRGLIKSTDKSIKLKQSLNKATSNKKISEFAKAIDQESKKISQIIQAQSKITPTKTIKQVESIIANRPIIIKPRIKPPVVEIKKGKKIIIPIFKRKKEQKFKTLSKAVPTYDVRIKKRGKLIRLKKRLTKRAAQNLLAYQLDNSLARTGNLIAKGKAKKVNILPKQYAGAFTRIKPKLRPYKLKKGTKKSISGFIEKKKFVGDTRKEIIQLQLSRKTKKIKKKKPLTLPKKKEVKRKSKKKSKKKILKRKLKSKKNLKNKKK